VSSESKEIKVTDKRMFTAEGELREEYRFLNEKATEEPPPPAARPEPPPAPEPPSAQPPPASDPRRPAAAPEASGALLELPVEPSPFGGASFLALLEMLAEPALIYLGDIELPEGGTAENLEMARLHIDLLEVLRQKTAGNLTVQESTALQDLLYQLRVRYVQKRG